MPQVRLRAEKSGRPIRSDSTDAFVTEHITAQRSSSVDSLNGHGGSPTGQRPPTTRKKSVGFVPSIESSFKRVDLAKKSPREIQARRISDDAFPTPGDAADSNGDATPTSVISSVMGFISNAGGSPQNR